MIKVYGDIMLDRWIIGKANRISPEAPVPVLKETRQENRPGGAANLALNIASLEGTIGIFGAIGDDKEGFKLIECFSKYENIDCGFTIDAKITTTKNRLVGQSGQHIMRWDREEKYNGKASFSRLKNSVQPGDIVCISDYNKGTITKDTVKELISKDCIVLVDPKQSPEYYQDAFLVKPNMKEYKSWFGTYSKSSAFEKIKEYGWKWLVVTDGAKGIYVHNHKGEFAHFKEPVKEVADVTGAGDTVLAVIAYYLQTTQDVFLGAEKACYAAARAVEHRGVHVVTHEDLKREIIFTNGVFDILHTGHLKLLEFAKSKGEKLVVGINSDASTKRLKGNDRPLNNQDKRKEQLETLPWVDEVVIFDEDTPIDLIKKVKPSIIVKGGDYSIHTVVGNGLADVVIFPTVEGHSTTKIVERIHDKT